MHCGRCRNCCKEYCAELTTDEVKKAAEYLKMEECRPDGCKKYPYTDQPGRLGSLYGMLDAIAVCPMVYEIWERLKKIYNFH